MHTTGAVRTVPSGFQSHEDLSGNGQFNGSPELGLLEEEMG